MTQTAPRLLLTALLLPVLLGGCDALYDDTKGWANRLEASLVSAGTEAGEPAPEAAGAAVDAPPAEMPAPPAVPVEAVAVTPLAAPAAPAKPAGTTRAAEPQGVLAEASAALLAPAPETPAKAPEAPTKAPEPPAKAETVAATPAAPKPKPAAPASDEAVVAVVLHLSSLRSEEAARRQWSDLQKSFPKPLGDLQAEFRRTELGEKGTFYRVLAGPLPTRDRAGDVCAALKAKDARQYCRILPQPPKS